MQSQIENNIRVHDRIHAEYEHRHGEIFNDIEQKRIHTALTDAASCIDTPSVPRTALDYGCGSGNLTKHLLNLNFDVVAADVSPKFLDMVNQRYGHSGTLKTLQLNGRDLSNIKDASFDFVGTYSVLHHVPEYLVAIEEMARVIRPGGVVFLDHEPTPEYWSYPLEYDEFMSQAMPKGDRSWRRFLKLSTYIGKLHRTFDIRRRLNPRYMPGEYPRL